MAMRPDYLFELLKTLRQMHGSTQPPEALQELSDELSDEVKKHFSELASRVRDLQSLLASSREHSDLSALQVFVAGLAEELAVPDSTDNKWSSREGGFIVSWPDLSKIFDSGINPHRVPEWALEAFQQVAGVVGNSGFPCVFGRSAMAMKSGWACFVENVTEDKNREIVRKAILSYYGVLKRFSAQKALLMPLSVVVKPVYPALSNDEYAQQAWDLFQYLHDHDSVAWPVGVPTDPNAPTWTFCFAGQQFFSNVSHPAHKIHTSRNLGDSLAFVMQPRKNFDVVASDTPKGRKIRNKIRQRAEAWEGRTIDFGNLGFFGSDDNRDWKQMVVAEPGESPPDRCPLHITRKGDKGK